MAFDDSTPQKTTSRSEVTNQVCIELTVSVPDRHKRTFAEL